MSTSIRHAHAIADLVAAGEVYVSIWPLLRAQLELGGRLAGITDIGNDTENTGPSRRCAQWFLEQLASASYRTTALKALRSEHTGAARERPEGQMHRLLHELVPSLMAEVGVPTMNAANARRFHRLLGHDLSHRIC